MNTYTGKDEMINGKWYSVTVQADSLKEAKKCFILDNVKVMALLSK